MRKRQSWNTPVSYTHLDVYKRQALTISGSILDPTKITAADIVGGVNAATGAETGLEVVRQVFPKLGMVCLLYTSHPGDRRDRRTGGR